MRLQKTQKAAVLKRPLSLASTGPISRTMITALYLGVKLLKEVQVVLVVKVRQVIDQRNQAPKVKIPIQLEKPQLLAENRKKVVQVGELKRQLQVKKVRQEDQIEV